VRDTRGKNAARRARRAGRIPAVLYGGRREPVSLAVDPRDVLKVVRSSSGYNTIFNLAVAGGETTPVMVVDQQADPITGAPLHADFQRIDLGKRLRVGVPVRTVGDPKGVKQQGGLLEIVTRAIEIECLPDDIPEHFTLDVTELLIGQAKRAGEVALRASMKLTSPADAVIAHVVALRAEAAPAAAEAVAPKPEAAAAAAEPEVIKKGKKEEEAPPEEKGKKK
jgi:large subunit ribosomal protein L25